VRAPAFENRTFDPAERDMYARDAHGSVTLMALLFLLWGAVSLATVPIRPFGVWNVLQTIVGTLAFVYFVRTRKHPSTRIAVGFAAAAIVYSLILLPWTAVAWCALGRPWEAFTVPQVGIVTMALVVPRFFWLGAAAIGLFTGECAFAYLYARHMGMHALVPVTEPLASCVIMMLGVGLLLLREQRRRMARHHIRMQAEANALRRVGPLFTTIRDALDAQLVDLSHELRRLDAAPSVDSTLPPMRRAVDRLIGVTERLDNLLEEEPTAAPPLSDTGGAIASAAERELLARDAHSGATLVAALLSFAGAIVVLAIRALGLSTWSLFFGLNVLSFAMLAYLLRTRRHPSERRALWVVLVLFGAGLPIISYNQFLLFSLQRPYAPFMGHKVLMLALGLLSGRKLWLRLGLIVTTAGSALVIYFLLHLAEHKNVISLAEPWVMLVYMLVGIVLLIMREQRRAASIRFLRSESERSALQRRTSLLLALRDQLNSPLQVLVLRADALDPSHQVQDVAQIRAGVDRLVEISGRLGSLESLMPRESHRVSLDGEQELSRRT
jgi:hypothetical protein